MLNQTCPLPAVIPDVDAVPCSEQFGQIQKFGFRLIEAVADMAFADEAAILAKANWEALITAVNASKLVISPAIPGIVIPNAEEMKEEGGNNNTINGMSIPVGKGFVKVTGKPLNLPVSVAKQLEALSPFTNVAGTTLLEAFFFNEAGQIIYKKDETGCKGFPIYNLFISSVGTEGLNKPNTHVFSFELTGDWDTGLEIASPLKNGTATVWDPRKL